MYNVYIILFSSILDIYSVLDINIFKKLQNIKIIIINLKSKKLKNIDIILKHKHKKRKI